MFYVTKLRNDYFLEAKSQDQSRNHD